MTIPNIKVRNPRDGSYDSEIRETSAEELHVLASGLRAQQKPWSRQALQLRAETLQAWADAIEADSNALLQALTLDTGRRLISLMEVNGAVRTIRRWCADVQTLPSQADGYARANPQVRYQIDCVPYALVGCISPWNFPLTLALIDAIPALLAGAAVIIKPSEVAPRFAAPLRALIDKVPALARVLSVVDGAGATGAALLDEVDAVCFTGSVTTGRRVGLRCAARMIPAFLELGGKDPAIVLKSADIERAASAILRASVSATGQACQSLERIYVERSIEPEFRARLIELATACELNFPDIGKGQIGPLIFATQAGVINAQIDDAKAQGATVHCGGSIENLGGGLWLRPTVVTGVSHAMRLMTEETFGPVMPIMAFDSAEEAIELANAGDFGLSAAVFAGSNDEALLVARELEAGAVSINDGALTSLIYDAEKNSFKQSGIGGSRMGAAGFTRFFRKRALLIQEGTPASMAMFEEGQVRP